MDCKTELRLANLGPLVLLLLGCFFAYQAIVADSAKVQTLNAPTTLAAHTKHISPLFKRIQNVRVGERAAPVKNPTGEFDDSLGREVDPATWRKLALRAEKRDGTYCSIELLRPKWWIDERAAQVGGSVYISVPECGIDGNAQVLSIGACPAIQPGTGAVVIGTFAHQSAEVINVYVEDLDEPIGVTVSHPFWSDTRQEFVASGKLQPGERLRGIVGNPRITSIQPRGPPEPVYNVEVLGEHVYEVTTAGLLVHNTAPCNMVTEISLPGGGKVDLNAPKIPAKAGGTGAAYDEIAGQGVYILRDPRVSDPIESIRYVGRGDAPERLFSHAQPGSGKEDLVGDILFNNNLSETHAKSLEQELQQLLGGPQSTNPQTSLRNVIQGIGEGNPNYLELEFAAGDDLVIEALRRARVLR